MNTGVSVFSSNDIQIYWNLGCKSEFILAFWSRCCFKSLLSDKHEKKKYERNKRDLTWDDTDTEDIKSCFPFQLYVWFM